MKYCFLVIFVLTLNLKLYSDSLYFFPSVYYTYGSYNNQDYSNSVSAYIPFFYHRYYLILGYDNIKIQNQEWNYNQQNFMVNPIALFYPFYIKASVGYVKGDFEYIPYEYNYSDKTNIYNFDIVYNHKYQLYFGGGLTFIKITGGESGNNGNVIQPYLRFEYIPDYRILFSIQPVYSVFKSKTKYFGVNTKINYLLKYDFLIKSNLFLGNNLYRFDPDVLTFSNQNDVQTLSAGIQIEYDLFGAFKVIGAFQHSKFENYSINYFTIGLKSSLIL